MHRAANPDEQRAFPRSSLTARARIAWKNGEFWAYSTDVSLSGLFVETLQPLALDDVVRVSFLLLGAAGPRHVAAEGRVRRRVELDEARRTSRLPGIGIAFERFVEGRAELYDELRRRQEPVHLPAAETGERTQRQYPRLPVGLPVRLRLDASSTETDALLDNLSAGGAYILTEAPAPVGSLVHLAFELPLLGDLRTIEASARVLRSNPPDAAGSERPGMGVSWLQSSIDPAPLGQFLRPRLELMRRNREAADRLEPPDHRV